MTFNKKITLLKIQQGKGTDGRLATEQAVVWAKVEDVGITTKFSAETANRRAELSVTMWRSEYHNYTHCDIDGIRYAIETTGRAGNDLHIKLILAKGG